MNKRKVLALVLTSVSIYMAGCGKTTSVSNNVVPDTTTPTVTEEVPEDSVDTEDSATSEEAPDGTTESVVYPSSTDFTDIAMGIDSDLCTFRVPLDYVLAGVCYDENGEKQTMEGLNSATTTVGEALDAGAFSTDQHLAEFSMTSLNGDGVVVGAKFYSKDSTPWSAFQEHFSDAIETGTSEHPGLIYTVETGSGDSTAVAIKVNEDYTLEITYNSSSVSASQEIVGEELYNLVSFNG